MNQCQDYTYDKSGNFISDKGNSVIKSYMERVLRTIKAQQDEILNEYSESCINEVSSCLSSNGYADTAGNTTKTIAMNACRPLIKTCASVVNAGTRVLSPDEQAIIDAATGTGVGNAQICPSGSYNDITRCPDQFGSAGSVSSATVNICPTAGCRCYDGYRYALGVCSKACPLNSEYTTEASQTGAAGKNHIWVLPGPNTINCKCTYTGTATSAGNGSYTCPTSDQ